MLDKLDADIKVAMLSGDKVRAEVIKSLKNAILNEEIALGVKDKGLNEDQISKVLAREAKKRQEATELYKQGGNNEKAETELSEKKVIEEYLPEQMDETAILALVKEEIAKMPAPTMTDMGKIIGAVKAKTGPNADGATIARLVKENLQT